MEKLAYAILLVLAAAWIVAMVVGSIAAFPAGVIGLAALAAIGLLFVKVVRDRIANREDDYYTKKVDK